MQLFKDGGHQLFSPDENVERTVRETLEDVRVNGLDAVRRRARDGWTPDSFELTPDEIRAA